MLSKSAQLNLNHHKQQSCFFKFTEEEVGSVLVCSIYEFWMPTQETGYVDGPCGGRETLPFSGMSFYTVQNFPIVRY